MIVRVVGICFILAGTSSMGFITAWRYQRRTIYLEEIYEMAQMLYGEIECKSALLLEAFLSMEKQSSGIIKNFLEILCRKMGLKSGQPFLKIWSEAVNDCFGGEVIAKSDRELLFHLGSRLGYLDKKMQLNTIAFFMKQIEEQKKELQKQLPGKCKVSRCLGIVSGIFLTILIL